jgi:hypothetical protein
VTPKEDLYNFNLTNAIRGCIVDSGTGGEGRSSEGKGTVLLSANPTGSKGIQTNTRHLLYVMIAVVVTVAACAPQGNMTPTAAPAPDVATPTESVPSTQLVSAPDTSAVTEAPPVELKGHERGLLAVVPWPIRFIWHSPRLGLQCRSGSAAEQSARECVTAYRTEDSRTSNSLGRARWIPSNLVDRR